MTNGAGSSHGPRQKKKATGKKAKGRDPQAALKRKGWLPEALAKEKSG